MAAVSFTTFYESKAITSTTADAGADVVYTVPASHDGEVTLLLVTNSGTHGTGHDSINIQVYHSDTDSYTNILRAHTVARGDSYNVLGPSLLYLHAGDTVLAHKSAGTLDVSISGKQYYNPVRTI